MSSTWPTAPADPPASTALPGSGTINGSLGAYLRALRESQLVGVFRAELSGALREGNQALAGILGQGSIDELISAGQGLPWRDRSVWPALVDRLQRHGHVSGLETELDAGDHGLHSVLVDASLEQGSVVGLVVEITERRRAQRVVKRQEAENRTLLAAIPDLMIRLDEHGRCLDFRPPRGVDPEEPVSSYIGRPVSQLFPEAVAFLFTHHIETAARSGETQTFEYQLLEDGSLRDFEARIAVSGQGEVLALIRNITKRKRAEAERERLLNELQDAIRNVKRLSGLLPICSACKKIRDDKGYWKQVEDYVHEHSDADFTHSLCPECVGRLYPNFAERRRASEAEQASDDPPDAPVAGGAAGTKKQ